MDSGQPLHRLAARVRDARARMRLTQADFADRMAVTPLTVHRWETGQSRPRALALDRLRALEEAIASRGAAGARAEAPPGGPAAAPSVPLDFAGDPAAVLLVAEAHRLAHGHQFNAAFASETARIDPLPHQRIAVYERMLKQDPLRFLLADDAGAGKTIMTGLYMREMLFRRRIRRVLIVAPAGLVGNWERELRTLFRLECRIVSGADARAGASPFSGAGGDRVIVSLDTLATERAFAALRAPEVAPYDLVVFDEAHKLSASRTGRRVTRTRRYRLAEALAGAAPDAADAADGGGASPPAAATAAGDGPFAGLSWAARHLLLLTATPHMGRESPYFHLWRLLDHRAFGAPEALRRCPPGERQRHFIRRTKEEMVDLEGAPLYRQRECSTFSFDLSGGEDGEHTLYLRTTDYLREHYDRALRNRPAVQLAMSVFQRRLASSTSALLRSFERRIEKIERDVADWRSGRLDAALLRRRQRTLSERYREDFFEAHGADEDAREGGLESGGLAPGGGPEPGERHEDFEDAVLGAVTAAGIEELCAELEALRGLRDHARALIAAGDESKFEKLREVLEDPLHAKEKWLVFSEHRDTVDFLVRRIEGLGYSDQVAVIHGGMAWPEREAEVERFRQPDGARFLVATDAAGEGINLQFCRLMVNYDIPWNPARLEQRMGRIHRYGQKHDVRVVNLVAGGTHEGRVLKVLLEKLEEVRRELRSDKVFDVIGRLLENVSLREYMMAALDRDHDRSRSRSRSRDRDRERGQGVLEAVERAVTGSAVRRLAEAETSVYGTTAAGEVAPRVDGMRRELDRERYLHLLPAYVRLFVESAARKLGIGLRGDLDGVFSLVPAAAGALDPLLPALEGYPPAVRGRLRIRRPDAGEACIWLHPGEPVFDALCRRVIDRFSPDARRGAIFIDPRADEPALWHLAAASVEEEEDDPAGAALPPGETPGPARPAPARPPLRRRSTLASRLIALRQNGGGAEEAPVERPPDALLALYPAPGVAPGSVPLAGRATALRAGASAHVERSLSRTAEEHRAARRAELPERRRRVNVSFDLQAAALARRRSELARAAAAADPVADEDVAALKREQAALSSARERVLRELDAAPDRIVAAPPRFLAHALALPPFPGSDVERMDERVEAVAVRVAAQAEADRGADVQDVSSPEKARAAGLSDWPGFDLLSRRPSGEVRSIEVKGRAGQAAVRMELNEWRQACNLGERYWLYAVFDCATPTPRLYRVRDPFRNLLTAEHAAAAFTLTAGSIVRAAEPEPPS